MDYKNGKIYKITSDSTDKIYIGSTCQPLYKRIGEHRNHYKVFLNGKGTLTTSFELIALGDAIITLIEDYPCERKEQLHARERYYIEVNKDVCVNKFIPGRTIKEYNSEYYQANIDKLKEANNKYHQENKDKLKDYAKQRITCICGKSITICKKSRHEKTKKHQAFINHQS